MNTKIKLLQLGKTQVDLLRELRNRGYTSMIPATVSSIINRKLNTPLAFKVRAEIDKILDEWEEEKNSK